MQDNLRELESEIGKIPVWEASQILMVVDDDEELFRDLMDAYCEDALTGLEEISIGLTSESLDAIEHTSHALKGSSANVGGERASEACLRMEQAARGGDLARCRALFDIIDREVTHFVTTAQQMALKDLV